jgi:hypothetical protein
MLQNVQSFVLGPQSTQYISSAIRLLPSMVEAPTPAIRRAHHSFLSAMDSGGFKVPRPTEATVRARTVGLDQRNHAP